MNKKLFTAMLTLTMAISATTILVGCDKGDNTHTHTFATEWTTNETHHWKAATCEHTAEVSEKAEHNWGTDGKCTACQKSKPIVDTINQTEWASFFNSLIDDVNHAGTATVSMGTQEMTLSYKKEDNIRYMEQTVGTNSMKQYLSFNDDTLSYNMYVFDENNGWWNSTVTCTSEEEYADRKFGFSFYAAIFPKLSAEANGEKLYVTELYSAFTYDEGKYSATLYDGEENAHAITLTFENGKLVLGEVSATTGTSVCTFTYDNVEVVIPQDALDAQPRN